MTRGTELLGPVAWVGLALGGLLLSGGLGLLFPSRSRLGERVASWLALVSCGLGWTASLLFLGEPMELRLELAQSVLGTPLAVGFDSLSAWFAVPVFAVGALAILYSFGYWPAKERPRHGRRLRLSLGWLIAGMVGVLLARDGLTLLMAWEFMALSNFLAVTTEERRPEVQRAGWLYLIYSHGTILALVAFLAVLSGSGFGLGFEQLPLALGSDRGGWLFFLACLAFGIKAGAMPLHSWLPVAHAAAPSHVSALMSGVVIKLGIYGLLRVTQDVAQPPLVWGGTVLAAGALAGFLGVLFALGQHDLKRLLAFHSIENIGIILMGFGLALLGRSSERPELVVLGLAGALFHVWNHALFKSLLFFGAGSVLHATGTRELERLGGLARRMPWTAASFLVGAVAICGLPPGNGFASELLVYLGLFRSSFEAGSSWAALAAPVLAATGALAVACFVKVYGVVFLGVARSARAERAGEAGGWMRTAMLAGALLCAALGLAPVLVASPLDRVLSLWSGSSELPGVLELAPLGPIGKFGAALLVGVVLLLVTLWPKWRRARAERPGLPTWDCGYLAPSPRLQYTASSFAELVTSRFQSLLGMRFERPRVRGFFPRPSHFSTHVEDPWLELLARRIVSPLMRMSLELRALPQGLLQRYLLYVLAILLPLLAWALVGSVGAEP